MAVRSVVGDMIITIRVSLKDVVDSKMDNFIRFLPKGSRFVEKEHDFASCFLNIKYSVPGSQLVSDRRKLPIL